DRQFYWRHHGWLRLSVDRKLYTSVVGGHYLSCGSRDSVPAYQGRNSRSTCRSINRRRNLVVPYSSSPETTYSNAHATPRPRRVWRVARMLILLAVLGLAFVGYLSPDMKL